MPTFILPPPRVGGKLDARFREGKAVSCPETRLTRQTVRSLEATHAHPRYNNVSSRARPRAHARRFTPRRAQHTRIAVRSQLAPVQADIHSAKNGRSHAAAVAPPPAALLRRRIRAWPVTPSTVVFSAHAEGRGAGGRRSGKRCCRKCA